MDIYLVACSLAVAAAPSFAGTSERAAQASVTDDAPAILAGIQAAGSGQTYSLPNKTLFIPNGLALTSACNGVTIQGQANTIIVGGQPVSGWQAMQSSDPHFNDIPAAARSHIQVASAPYLASLGSSPTVELYMGSSVQSQPVWPLPTGGTRNDGWLDIPSAGQFGGQKGNQQFQHASDNDPTTWNSSRFGTIWVEGWAYEGSWFYGNLSAVDATNTTVTNYGGWYTGVLQKGDRNLRFRYRNVLEELQLPGQYWIDSGSQTVYWYPPASYTNQPTFLSAGKGGIAVNGASGITIQGSSASSPLPIVGNQNDAIDLQGASNITLANVQIFGCGQSGLRTTDFKSTNVTVNNCDFIGCGWNAIHLCCGDRLNRTPGGVNVSSPYVTQWGRIQMDRAAVELPGMAPTLSNAYIANGPGQAILLGSDYVGVPHGQDDGANDATVTGCLVDNAAGQTSDDGGIYFGRNWAALGNKIVNTTVQNMHPYVGQGKFQSLWGIYLDDGQAGATVQHCTIKNCEDGIFVGGGWGNTIQDVHLDSITNYGVALDSRASSGGWAHSHAAGGALFKSVTQWFPWGQEPASWSAAYDNLDGQGHGLASWMKLYDGVSTEDPTFGVPQWNLLADVTYAGSMSKARFVDADAFKDVDEKAGWNYRGQALVPKNVAKADTGGAPAFTGRTSPLVPGF